MTTTTSNATAKVGILLLSIPVALFAHGVVIQQWWQWFLVPHGLNAITLTQAILLRFGASLLTAKRDRREDEKESLNDIVTRTLVWAIVLPGLFWLLGLAFKTWLPL